MERILAAASLLFATNCDQGKRPSAPEPAPKVVEREPVVPAPVPPPAPSQPATPTPAATGHRIVVRERSASPQAECQRKTLALKLIGPDKKLVDRFEETSTCEG